MQKPSEGEGDAKATDIYAKAYSKDADFYSFYQSLNAYQEAFKDKSDVMVVDPKSDFFKFFNRTEVVENKLKTKKVVQATFFMPVSFW